MKIIYICHSLHQTGGVPRVLSSKANELAKKNIEIVFITNSKNHVIYFDLHPSIKVLNISDSCHIDGIFNVKLYKKNLEKELSYLNADITISMVYSSEFYFINEFKDGSRKFAEFHATFQFAYGFHNLRYNLKNFLLEKKKFFNVIRSAKKFEKLIVLTQTDQKRWSKYLKNTDFINNPITIEHNRKSKLDQKNIIAIGRLEKVKGFEDLIKVWAEVEKQNTGWKLEIYGEGPEEGNLQKLLKEFNLNSVFIKNFENYLNDIYLNSSIHLMTSKFEGMPLVLMEAMSFGIPTISFETLVGPVELIENYKTGILVPNRDISRMANEIHKLICDDNLRKSLGDAAFEKSKLYSIETITEKWRKLFKETTAAK